ncbi:MAG: cobalt ECF transporter T component CbiQ [Desulfuromonas sp.]|nr:MAG: cobalt ECF transporter T component CbiQ [Desulfuromonas sp.]
MTDPQIIHLPGWLLPVGLLVPPLLALTAVRILRRRARRAQKEGETEPDWSVPQVDILADADSPVHRWDVRCKWLGLLGYAFLLVSLQQLHWVLAGLVGAMAAVPLARLPWTRTLLRLLAMSGFLAMFLIIMPLSAAARPGDTVLLFGSVDWLTFNLRGLELALLIIGKAVAVALLMEPLLATAPLNVTLQGLNRLGVPSVMTQMASLSHRYIHVFREEASRMATGMQVRGFRKRSDRATAAALGNFLGMLLVRSFERTERVHEAMQARGYTGRLPATAQRALNRRDILFTCGWLGLGLALLVIDRLI